MSNPKMYIDHVNSSILKTRTTRTEHLFHALQNIFYEKKCLANLRNCPKKNRLSIVSRQPEKGFLFLLFLIKTEFKLTHSCK